MSRGKTPILCIEIGPLSICGCILTKTGCGSIPPGVTMNFIMDMNNQLQCFGDGLLSNTEEVVRILICFN